MSSIVDDQVTSRDSDLARIRNRIKRAKSDRRRYEPQWHQNLAFAAGKQWLQWHTRERRLVLPKLPDGRERYTADVLTQYRWTALGELTTDDDLPELLFAQEDMQGEEFADEINSALEWGWENEFQADEVLLDLKLKLIDLGTAAIRCRFDNNAGPIKANVPHLNGRPLLDVEQAHEEVINAAAAGRHLQFKDIHEGKIRLDVGSPFNFLVPPGMEHERDFPWECWVGPELLDTLRDQWGARAAGLRPDEISSVSSLGASEMGDILGPNPEADTGQPGKLEDHVLVYTYFERPSPKFPKGRVVTLAGDEMRVIDEQPQLPYQGPDGTYRSGITYFHYWRVTGRFWGKALIEPGIGPQRALNKRRSQIAETIDRGQPKVFIEEGTMTRKPTGRPVEVIELAQGAPLPKVDGGIQPGPWMNEEVAQLIQDLERALGIHTASLGANPQGVGNYSQLALLKEADQTKLGPILKRLKSGIGHVVENVLWDMREYWGSEKRLAIVGEENFLQEQMFNASKIPTFFRVKVATGAARPRSVGAQLKKIDDIATFSINSGQPLPVSWLLESYDSGEPAELPDAGATSAQQNKALMENDMLAQGLQPEVDYFDPAMVHIPYHRLVQIQARLAGRQDIWDNVEQHIQIHLQQEAQKAEAAAAQQAAGAAAAGQDMPFPHPSAFSLFNRPDRQPNFGA